MLNNKKMKNYISVSLCKVRSCLVCNTADFMTRWELLKFAYRNANGFQSIPFRLQIKLE